MITVEAFKKYFQRDFPFLPTEYEESEKFNYILDEDIEKSMGEMKALLPVSVFEDEVLEIAQMYLTAHCLVGDIRRSNQGLASNFTFPLQSRSVGSVSESYGIPQKFLSSPSYAYYITTDYGLKYFALLYPRTRGHVQTVTGWTLP